MPSHGHVTHTFHSSFPVPFISISPRGRPRVLVLLQCPVTLHLASKEKEDWSVMWVQLLIYTLQQHTSVVVHVLCAPVYANKVRSAFCYCKRFTKPFRQLKFTHMLQVFRALLLLTALSHCSIFFFFQFRPWPPSYRMRSEQVLKSKQVETPLLLHPLRGANILWHMAEPCCLSNLWKSFEALQTFVHRPSLWSKQENH